MENDIIALVITIALVMLGKQGCNKVLNRPAPRVIGKDSPWNRTLAVYIYIQVLTPHTSPPPFGFCQYAI